MASLLKIFGFCFYNTGVKYLEAIGVRSKIENWKLKRPKGIYSQTSQYRRLYTFVISIKDYGFMQIHVYWAAFLFLCMFPLCIFCFSLTTPRNWGAMKGEFWLQPSKNQTSYLSFFIHKRTSGLNFYPYETA